MADIELVIKIPEDVYKNIQSLDWKNAGRWFSEECKAIHNGTPLPKGHGRLIDADELYGDFIDGTEGYDCNTWNRIEIGYIIEDTPTIIEADGGAE